MTSNSREEIVLTKGRSKRKQELYFFQENVLLDDICSVKQNLRTLVIIGQPQLTSLNAVSKLVHLRELWVVECKIKDISCLKGCSRLEKLYVYSNEIERIPNLSKASRLTIISLSGNNIRRITNINKLEHLQELHLANNKLTRLPNVFGKNSNLSYINLAGNRLYRMKDIKNLRGLQKLESIVFNDPLYGECPLTRLCNYRSYVIYWLPRVSRLDHYSIDIAERCWINTFFKRKVIYYNVSLHNNINNYLVSLKESYNEYREKNKNLKKLLQHSRMLQEKKQESTSVSEENALSLIELEEKRLKGREEMAFSRLRISYQQLKLHLHHCGNVFVREYTNSTNSTNSTESTMIICQKILEDSLCTLANNTIGITGVHLRQVTEVIHKEINEYRVSNDKKATSHENNQSFKLLASTPGVENIREWPLNVFQSEFYNQSEISVTNCLAIADAKFYEEFSKRERIVIDPCEKRRICIILRVPFNCMVKERYVDGFHEPRHFEKDDRDCKKYFIKRPNLCGTVFVAEYEYLYENDQEEDNTYEINSPSPQSSIERLTKHELSTYLRSNELDLLVLTKISLAGQGIKTWDDSLDLPNLKELDLSYNRLELFPNAQIILHLAKLNLSFNNIRWIRLKDTLSELEDLDISWNRLAKCTKTLQSLQIYAPNLKVLNFEKNPFLDINEHEKIILLTRAYLPSINDAFNDKLADNILEKIQICPLDQREDAWSIDCETSGVLNENEELISTLDVTELSEKRKKKRTRHIHVSTHDTFTELRGSRKLFNASTICVTHCPIIRLKLKKPSMHLVRLNLSDNCITTIDGLTQEYLPRLKYLDLTNNLITSLKPLGIFNTMQELYCAHNEIRRLQEIENLKSWQRLRVVDLSYNPTESEISYKDFLIFHLINLKYVSGQYVETSDIIQARNIFGNVLDKNMLLAMNLGSKLTNIKQLDIVKCSVKKINLPSNLLVHLESLDLSKNQITSLENLNILPKLKTLCMSYNHLEVLDMDQFKNSDAFPNLCTLHLDHNRIGSLTLSDGSHSFPTLKHLFLHYNKLENLNGLRQNSTLETLIMDHNKIEAIDINCFHEDNKIMCLSLESNKIQDLQFIKRLSLLKKLYIADNCIIKEDELVNLNSLEHLEELTLIGNPICKMINCYTFCLRNFPKIKMIDGVNLFNKISGFNDSYIYECTTVHSIAQG